jgi:hypothetical protein
VEHNEEAAKSRVVKTDSSVQPRNGRSDPSRARSPKARPLSIGAQRTCVRPIIGMDLQATHGRCTHLSPKGFSMTFQSRFSRALYVVMLTLSAVPLGTALAAANTITRAEQTIATYRRTDPGLDHFFNHSAGYAVFPSVGKGGLVVGGAYGDGVLFEGGRPVGTVSLSQLSIGTPRSSSSKRPKPWRISRTTR